MDAKNPKMIRHILDIDEEEIVKESNSNNKRKKNLQMIMKPNPNFNDNGNDYEIYDFQNDYYNPPKPKKKNFKIYEEEEEIFKDKGKKINKNISNTSSNKNTNSNSNIYGNNNERQIVIPEDYDADKDIMDIPDKVSEIPDINELDYSIESDFFLLEQSYKLNPGGKPIGNQPQPSPKMKRRNPSMGEMNFEKEKKIVSPKNQNNPSNQRKNMPPIKEKEFEIKPKEKEVERKNEFIPPPYGEEFFNNRNKYFSEQIKDNDRNISNVEKHENAFGKLLLGDTPTPDGEALDSAMNLLERASNIGVRMKEKEKENQQNYKVRVPNFLDKILGVFKLEDKCHCIDAKNLDIFK
ncbi:MAG: hypothetical protein MJ252_07205 [archaeon]|nr:hypothetical protein [archaeon]